MQSCQHTSRRSRESLAYIVNKMLIRKSQLHPVTNAADAGGNMIATCFHSSPQHRNIGRHGKWMLTRMRTTSEALNMVMDRAKASMSRVKWVGSIMKARTTAVSLVVMLRFTTSGASHVYHYIPFSGNYQFCLFVITDACISQLIDRV